MSGKILWGASERDLEAARMVVTNCASAGVEVWPSRSDLGTDRHDVWLVNTEHTAEQIYTIADVSRSVHIIESRPHRVDGLSTLRSDLAGTVVLGTESGHMVYADEADLGILSEYTWIYDETRGVLAYSGGGFKNHSQKLMSRVLLAAPKTHLVDHINRNHLDNRRRNLRLANRQQNAANMWRGTGRCGFKGVIRRGASFLARIKVDYKVRHLGTFHTAEAAARAYDEAARRIFGDFARCNFGQKEDPKPANIFLWLGQNMDVRQLAERASSGGSVRHGLFMPRETIWTSWKRIAAS